MWGGLEAQEGVCGGRRGKMEVLQYVNNWQGRTAANLLDINQG